MDPWVYPRERSLGRITLVIGLLFWTLLIVGTFGIALFYVMMGMVIYLFVHSALISYVKGNAVELTADQFPDLRAQFDACCERLGMTTKPDAYVLHGDGIFNAFATRFLGRHFVILLSDVVDAMQAHPDGVSFYIGHELGHIRMKHLTGHLLRWPALWIPLLGPAYARAQESTCDRHGLACSSSPEHAARALGALAAGGTRWQTLNLAAYRHQARRTGEFWLSYHELTNGYPWLTKRVARVLDPEVKLPSRAGFAWFLAMFVPYVGRSASGGGAVALLMVVAIVGILAAVAVPAYADYTKRAKLSAAYIQSGSARNALGEYHQAKDKVPATLAEAGVSPTLPDGTRLTLDAETMEVTVETESGSLLLTPTIGRDGRVRWQCRPGEGVKAALAPKECREGAATQ